MNTIEDYTSENTDRLKIEELTKILIELPYIKNLPLNVARK